MSGGDDKKNHRGVCKDLCEKILVAMHSKHLRLPGSDFSRKLEATIDDLNLHVLEASELGVRVFRYVKTHLQQRHQQEDAGSQSPITKELRQGLDKMLEYVTSDKWNEFFAKLKEDDDKLMLAKAHIVELMQRIQQLEQQIQQQSQMSQQIDTSAQPRKRRQGSAHTGQVQLSALSCRHINNMVGILTTSCKVC